MLQHLRPNGKHRKPQMTSDKHLPWHHAEVVPPSFYSSMLTRLARQLVAPLPSRRSQPSPPVLEFYADASAPEGALYVDGKLVGWINGVKRL
jgi:hypothetical protein